MNPLVVVPIVLPLAAGALLVALESARSRWAAPFGLAATLLGLVAACALAVQAQGPVQAYLPGNWPAPWGIALVLDRLAALMLVLSAAVAMAAQLRARQESADGAGHFQSLFQLQLMGLNGAFLSADLFNLFVFFEVLLAASYGLLLHGGAAGRRERLRAGFSYVALNLAGSALFLVAASLFYGVAGTLSLADLALKLPRLAPAGQALAQAAGGLLLLVFALKAALLPLHAWLPGSYAAAGTASAVIFTLLTKLGVYAALRVVTLGVAPPPPVLLALALATLVAAALGALTAVRLRMLVAWLVPGSAALVLVALGLGGAPALAAGLFYLAPGTLALALAFVLADRIAGARGGSDGLQPRAMAGRRAALGAAFFASAVAAAGLPPLAGFLGKALLVQAAGQAPHAGWVIAAVLASSLMATVALARAGMVVFWQAEAAPPVPLRGGAAAAWLLALLVAATVGAGPLSQQADAMAAQLLDRRAYLAAVLATPPVPPAHDVRRELRERGELP